MGTDIHGYIEFRLHHTVGIWCGAINIGPMAERYYNLFGYLFGVRGSGDKFLPIASDRGIPPDVAEETAPCRFPSFAFSSTSLTSLLRLLSLADLHPVPPIPAGR